MKLHGLRRERKNSPLFLRWSKNTGRRMEKPAAGAGNTVSNNSPSTLRLCIVLHAMCGDHWSIKGIGGSGATLLVCFTGSRGAAGIIGFCGAGAGWAF